MGVALGAAVGAELRYLVLSSLDWGLWPTLAVNVAGSMLLGGLAARSRRRRTQVPPWLGAGLIGAFTTFSTFLLDVYELAERDGVGLALVFAAFSLSVGIGATALVLMAGREGGQRA